MDRQKVAKQLVAAARELTARDIKEDAAVKKFEALKKKAQGIEKATERVYQTARSVGKDLSVLKSNIRDSSDIPRNSEVEDRVNEASRMLDEVLKGLNVAVYSSSRAIKAADADLQAIADVVKDNSFLGLRRPLKALGLKKVDFSHAGFPHWSMKTRRGKTVAIVNKKYADPDSRDIVVGDFVVGYM